MLDTSVALQCRKKKLLIFMMFLKLFFIIYLSKKKQKNIRFTNIAKLSHQITYASEV